MCEQVRIPDETYSARVLCTDIPDHLYETWLTMQVGTKAKRLWDIQNTISAFSIISLILTLIMLFFTAWTLSICFVVLAIALIFCAVRMSCTDWYQSVRSAQRRFPQTYPSYVVQIM